MPVLETLRGEFELHSGPSRPEEPMDKHRIFTTEKNYRVDNLCDRVDPVVYMALRLLH